MYVYETLVTLFFFFVYVLLQNVCHGQFTGADSVEYIDDDNFFLLKCIEFVSSKNHCFVKFLFIEIEKIVANR